MLRIEALNVRFGGLEVLSDLGLAVAPGEVLGLIGPNGSGKTTLFNVVTGVYPPTSGRVVFGDADVTGWPVHALARSGIARTFQNLRLFTRMTVRENVCAALHVPAASTSRGVRPEHSADDLLVAVDLARHRDRMVGELALAEQRRLELARALARDPRLLLLDEPAGGMTPAETDAMAQILRAVALPSRTCIIIEHKMDLITALCDRIVALDFGRKIADGDAADVLNDPGVKRAYLGEDGEAHAEHL